MPSTDTVPSDFEEIHLDTFFPNDLMPCQHLFHWIRVSAQSCLYTPKFGIGKASANYLFYILCVFSLFSCLSRKILEYYPLKRKSACKHIIFGLSFTVLPSYSFEIDLGVMKYLIWKTHVSFFEDTCRAMLGTVSDTVPRNRSAYIGYRAEHRSARILEKSTWVYKIKYFIAPRSISKL